MKVLIFGGRGYIGGKLLEVFPDAACPGTDIADERGVGEVLDALKPDVVINSAGKTGRPNVDWCEDHKMETVRGNVTGPFVLLEQCLKRSVYFVHVGSGCIYDGPEDRIFTEEDPPNFFGSFYSLTKSTSDLILSRFPILQLRLRMPFDGEPHPRNLIMKLRNYKKILDQKNSITYLPDFKKAIRSLTERKVTGTFNMVSPGPVSPYRVMELYRTIIDPKHSFEKLELSGLPTVVRAQRSNCVLSCRKLQDAGVQLTETEAALEDALRKLKNNL